MQICTNKYKNVKKQKETQVVTLKKGTMSITEYGGIVDEFLDYKG